MTTAFSLPSSSSSFCRKTIVPPRKTRMYRPVRVRAQRFRDDGRSSSLVDANLSLLRERMESVRIKEQLERCCNRSKLGWNYAPGYDYRRKREATLAQCYQLLGLVTGAAGFSILSGTFLLSLISLLVHLNP